MNGPGQGAAGSSAAERPARAAVDVGTNSVRLVVVDAAGRQLAREMTITRLGHGVDRTGRLDDASLARTLEVLRGYRDIWRDLGADGRVRIAATSAVRDAADRDRFFARVRDVTGCQAEVLSGEEEARITFRGATSALQVPPDCALLDVGGGSTEMIVGDGAGGVAGWVSLQLGCVRLTERCLPSDPPTPSELVAASLEVGAQLALGREVLAEQGADLAAASALVGVAGTVTTLAALHLGLEAYDAGAIHGTYLARADVLDLVDRLAAQPARQRARLGPVAAGREDIIVGGGIIVVAVLDRFGFDGVVASEADLLDGLVRG